mmetsp:Transcript_30675/g.97961  ORF Transcript_30675/g.97961 Transcript_30675/m.97961 type:complete len:238 (+) Transcript_30675:885-1598(+)
MHAAPRLFGEDRLHGLRHGPGPPAGDGLLERGEPAGHLGVGEHALLERHLELVELVEGTLQGGARGGAGGGVGGLGVGGDGVEDGLPLGGADPAAPGDVEHATPREALGQPRAGGLLLRALPLPRGRRRRRQRGQHQRVHQLRERRVPPGLQLQLVGPQHARGLRVVHRARLQNDLEAVELVQRAPHIEALVGAHVGGHRRHDLAGARGGKPAPPGEIDHPGAREARGQPGAGGLLL